MSLKTCEFELKVCRVCKNHLAPFRFAEGSDTCRDCSRWNRQPPRPIPIQAHKIAIGVLRKEPSYKQYVEGWQLRVAQHNTANFRGVGWKD